jgi:hypothetical protein
MCLCALLAGRIVWSGLLDRAGIVFGRGVLISSKGIAAV